MCLRQVKNSCPYHLPLHEKGVELANYLWRALEAIKPDQESNELDLEESVGHLHNLFWSLCGSEARVNEEAMWTDPLKCFIAVLNLTKEGTFREASAVTSDLATWKHNLRAMVLHQIVIQEDSFSGQLK